MSVRPFVEDGQVDIHPVPTPRTAHRWHETVLFLSGGDSGPALAQKASSRWTAEDRRDDMCKYHVGRLIHGRKVGRVLL